MTDTLTREEIETDPSRIYQTDDGDHDKFSHYVRKQDILRSQVEGVPCKALCGKVWNTDTNPDGLPICPECKEVYEMMQD